MASITGGEKLEAALNEIAGKIAKPATLSVGFLEGATYPDGTSVALVAAIHNYGAPAAGIPPRPFFSGMVADKSGEWPGVIANALKKWKDADAALALTGEVIQAQLQQSIRDFVGVPLKPATVERKGFAKQLVDTRHLLRSVGYEVK